MLAPNNQSMGDALSYADFQGITMDVLVQIIPADQNTTVWGGVTSKRYCVLANLGSDSGEGLDFVIGQMSTERY